MLAELVVLPRTRAGTARGYQYLPDGYESEDFAEGTLVIARCPPGRKGTEEEYRVQVERDRDGSVESVLLLKKSDGKVHEIACAGPHLSCTCEWATVERGRWLKDRSHQVEPCVHAVAVADLLAKGQLSEPVPETETDWREAVAEMDDWFSIYAPNDWT